MHLFDKLRASVRRKPTNKIELTLSEQIENLLYQSNRSINDHRLQLLRSVYEYRLRQFKTLNDTKRQEFEESMLKSLLAITSDLSSKSSSSSVFQRSSHFYRSMPTATSIQILKRKTKSN